MSRASELMDSRKFMAAMDNLVDYWTPKQNIEVPDERKAEALQAVLDIADANLSLAQIRFSKLADAEAHIFKRRESAVKALIPVPSVSEIVQQGVQGNLKADFEKSIKPKRKRRTKAEMAAAKEQPVVKKPRKPRAAWRIQPQSEEEVQKEQAPHITAMLAKVQARADAVNAPTFDVAFSREEGMFIQQLPMYLEAGGKFGVIESESKGFNPQYGWVLKIGRK